MIDFSEFESKAFNLTEDNIKHLHNIIYSFLELFDDDEYINFHNNFMLPLLYRVYGKYRKGLN